MLEKRRLIDKKDDYGSFSADFYGNKIILGKTELPIGQIATEFMKLEDEQFKSLREKTLILQAAAETIYDITATQVIKRDLKDFLPCFKMFLDELDKLPLFTYLNINQKQVINAFINTYNSDDEVEKTAEFIGMFLVDLMAYHDEIHIFRLYADTLLDDYVEYARFRQPKYYAKETHKFFNDKDMQAKLQGMLHPEKYDNIFMIEQPVNIEYVTRMKPVKKREYVIAERIVYRSLGGFLKAELFKALIAGNAPRACHNCKRYFLTIGGSQLLYCSRIAPNDPQGRTCLQVGRYKKQQEQDQIPYEKAYKRAYDRLKKRKKAGTLVDKTWNALVAEIQDIRDDARAGKIPDTVAEEKLNKY